MNTPEKNKPQRLIDWPYVLGLLLLPVAILLILFLTFWIQKLTRFNPRYFQGEYLDRYSVPGAVAINLERAFKDGDEELMTELLGTHRKVMDLEARPQLIFSLLLEVDGKYYDYLYFDASNYHRVIQHVTERKGRYITSKEDLYYYMDSGNWIIVAGPIVATWWALVIVFTGGVFIYRQTAVTRGKRLKEDQWP